MNEVLGREVVQLIGWLCIAEDDHKRAIEEF